MTVSYDLDCSGYGDGGLQEYSIYTAWYPIVYALKKMVYRVAVAHHEALSIVGSGEVNSTRMNNARIRTTLKSWRPEIDVAFFVVERHGRLVVKSQSLSVGVVHQNIGEETVRMLATHAQQIYKYFRHCFQHDPLKGQLTIAISDMFDYSYSRGGLIALAQTIVDRAESLDTKLNLIKTLAHEIAHIWIDFGKPIGSSRWVNEGTAEYYAVRYVNAFCNPRYLIGYFNHFKSDTARFTRLLSIKRIKHTNPGFFNQVYSKAAALVFQMSESLGVDIFDSQIAEIRNKFPDRFISGYTFVRELHFDVSKSGLIPDWLTRRRLPEISINVSGIFKAFDRYYVDIELSQRLNRYVVRVQLLFSDVLTNKTVIIRSKRRQSIFRLVFDFSPSIIIVEPNYRHIYHCVMPDREKTFSQLDASLDGYGSGVPAILDPLDLAGYARLVIARRDIELSKRLLQTIIYMNPRYHQFLKQWALIELGRLCADEGNFSLAARMYLQALGMNDYRDFKARSLSALKRLPGPYNSLAHEHSKRV